MNDCDVCRADISVLRSVDPPAADLSWPTIRLADLFSGCGGLSLGIQRAAHELQYSLDVKLALDSDQVAIGVYCDTLPTVTATSKLIEEVFDGELGGQLSATEIDIAERVGHLDFMLGGPPCQGHSSLNNHSRRDDPRNELYLRMARAAEVLLPSAIVIENVPAVTHDVQNAVNRTTEYLKTLEYDVGSGVVDLANLGVPQKRKRHIVIGLRGCSIGAQEILYDLGVPICTHVPRSVRWAIEDLEDHPETGLFNCASTPRAINQSRIDWLFDNDETDLPNELRPPCHRTQHSYVSMYGRMAWDHPAQTVTTGFNCMGQGRFVHPSRRRVITPHEAARLQMLPDYVSFKSIERRTQLAKLIGNSVPPLLSFAIGKAVIPHLTCLMGRRQSAQPSPESLVR